MNCCFVQQVLEHIRMPLISPYYIHDVIESLDVVRESLKCQRLISEAKDYMLLQDRRGELYGPRARPRRSTGTASLLLFPYTVVNKLGDYSILLPACTYLLTVC